MNVRLTVQLVNPDGLVVWSDIGDVSVSNDTVATRMVATRVEQLNSYREDNLRAIGYWEPLRPCSRCMDEYAPETLSPTSGECELCYSHS